MSFGLYAKRLLSVHKCAGCGRVLDFKDFDGAFCQKCELAWRVAKTENCPQCFHAATECCCMPSLLSKAGALTLHRTFFYRAERSREVQNKLIYYLKHHKNARVSDFAASQIEPLVKSEIEALGINSESLSESLAVVNVPRGRRAVTEEGFDQAAEVCKALAKRLGVSYVPVIKRRFGGKEQKKLSAEERRKNLKDALRIKYRGKNPIEGKWVLLFDDVVTTGSSMAACTRILQKSGARGVICACLASDMKKEMGKIK